MAKKKECESDGNNRRDRKGDLNDSSTQKRMKIRQARRNKQQLRSLWSK